MIAKTSSGRIFAGLAQYLEKSRSGQELDRVAWKAERNLGTDDPTLAARFMQATANANPRIEYPVYHFSVSFDPSDQVTPEQMQRVADRVLHELGLAKHQVLMVAHSDTTHPHVHVMVNRVHPETLRAWERWQDRPVIEHVLREEEQALGLREVRGTLYKLRQPERAIEQREAAREGETRVLTSAKQHLAEYRGAPSWDELEGRLDEYGLRLARKGQGLVITDGQHEVKASLVARDLSLRRLEARFSAPYPGDDRHLTAIERARLSPAVAEMLSAFHAIEAAARVRYELERLSMALRIAQTCKRQLGLESERVVSAAREFDHDLARVYRAPEAARTRFEQLAKNDGQRRALSILRERPEAFGALRTVDRKQALGLFIAADDSQARSVAIVAARSGHQLFEARGRLNTEVGEIVALTGKSFDDALALVYRNPAKARSAFEEALSHAGPAAATLQLADRPEVYGSLASTAARTDDIGRVRSVSESAHLAAEWATESIAIREVTSAATMQTYVHELIPRLDKRVRALDRESRREFDPRVMEQSLSRAMQRLAPAEFLELRRALTEPQRAIAAKFRQQVRDVVLGRDEMER